MKPENPNSRKVLCVCRGGNSRSVGMAYTLKYGWGHDAIAVGIEGNAPETMAMLCEWAEHIICMTPAFRAAVPSQHWHKTEVCDVGADRYFQPHEDLVDQCSRYVGKHRVLNTR